MPTHVIVACALMVITNHISIEFLGLLNERKYIPCSVTLLKPKTERAQALKGEATVGVC